MPTGRANEPCRDIHGRKRPASAVRAATGGRAFRPPLFRYIGLPSRSCGWRSITTRSPETEPLGDQNSRHLLFHRGRHAASPRSTRLHDEDMGTILVPIAGRQAGPSPPRGASERQSTPHVLTRPEPVIRFGRALPSRGSCPSGYRPTELMKLSSASVLVVRPAQRYRPPGPPVGSARVARRSARSRSGIGKDTTKWRHLRDRDEPVASRGPSRGQGLRPAHVRRRRAR